MVYSVRPTGHAMAQLSMFSTQFTLQMCERGVSTADDLILEPDNILFDTVDISFHRYL